MNRRAFLATAGAVATTGCTSRRSSPFGDSETRLTITDVKPQESPWFSEIAFDDGEPDGFLSLADDARPAFMMTLDYARSSSGTVNLTDLPIDAENLVVLVEGPSGMVVTRVFLADEVGGTIAEDVKLPTSERPGEHRIRLRRDGKTEQEVLEEVVVTLTREVPL